jgi:23S rRNA (adenine2503-C2)-methyltransferase
VQASPTDGFAKFLFECPDGARVEAVRIPVPCEPPATPEGDAARARVTGTWRGTRRRYVVCVSSQAGCALGCAFCATGAGGFRRNLRTWEIVAQVLEVRRTADRPVAGVVFMGMGEPLLNPDAVLRAARLFCDPSVGIAAEDITVSTAGIPAGIRRLAQARERFRLSVSLTSARPARRRVLMPVEDTHPTSEVVAAVREWTARTGRRAVIAWVMLGGPQGNCTPEEARALAELLDGLPVRLDLVELNGAVGGFVAPSEAEISAFRDELDRTLRQPVARRYSGGRDIDAACGMLAAKAAQRAPAS